MEYAGFWRRFWAMWIDAMVFVPIAFFVFYFAEKNMLVIAYWQIPNFLIGIWFYIYLVVRYGGTPGKLLLKIRIVMTDGTNVTVKAASLRYFVQCFLSLFLSIGIVLAVFNTPDSQYLSSTIIERAEVIESFAPDWYHTVDLLSEIWIWSEFVTMLMNKQRRAIHDFIAETAVIKVHNS